MSRQSKTNEQPNPGMKTKSKRKGVAPATLRTLVAFAMVVFVCIGLAVHTGTGTPSMFGISSVAALCPLGALEAAIASRIVVPAGFIGLAIVVIAVLLVGRAFCSWGCPMMLLRKLFGVKSPHERRVASSRKKARALKDSDDQAKWVDDAAICAEASTSEKPSLFGGDGRPDDAPDPDRGGVQDSRTWVLGGVVLTTAAFGFPVFCLICPVGLTFATVICLWRAIQFGEATWSLVLFPSILIIEVVVLRRWCHTLCPLGALIGLISRGNRTWRATLDANACLEGQGKSCGKCVEVCPEGIDLHKGALTTRRSECLKCGECRFACPVQAISFPFLPKKSAGDAAAADVAASAGVEAGADAPSHDNENEKSNEITSKGEAHE